MRDEQKNADAREKSLFFANALCYNAAMKRKRSWIICLVCLLLMSYVTSATAQSGQAENLTGRCTFDFGRYRKAGDEIFKLNGYQQFEANTSFSFRWKDSLPEARLCLYFVSAPEDVTVVQYDAEDRLVRSDTLPQALETVTPLAAEACRAVVQIGDSKVRIRWCAVFGMGELPEPFHAWIETPDHLDYLVISTHPDDDILFLGSVVPVYGAEEGFVGTIAYVTTAVGWSKRVLEAGNGAWVQGLRYRPLFWNLPDIVQKASQSEKDTFVYDDLLLATVRTYRRYRPVVVFAQDVNGEYGHWQHILTSKASREAFALAADPTFDPDSAEAYGTWQVQKLFLHLYGENQILIDAERPLSAFDGLNAYQIACKAFLKHQSQQGYGYSVQNTDDEYAFNRFGMAEGVVPVGSDVFDGIDPALLSKYVPPDPTPAPSDTPEPDDTPDPTDTPTPEPTEAMTEAPLPTQTPQPAETEAPTPIASETTGVTPQQADGQLTGFWIAGIILLVILIALLCALVLLRKKR